MAALPVPGGVLSIRVEGDTARGPEQQILLFSSWGRGEQDQALQRQIAVLHLLLFQFMRPRKNHFHMTCTHRVLGWWLWVLCTGEAV